MRVLIVGATGMLGQALVAEARHRGIAVLGIARYGADINIDLADTVALESALQSVTVDVVVNAAAIVSLELCEREPGRAYAVNARPVGCMAEYCRRMGIRFIQVSTDHYYRGDGRYAHTEDAPISLLNEYARTKFAGEAFALLAPTTLVLRTNIVGFRGDSTRPSLVEWIMDTLRNRKPLKLFFDSFHSPIHVADFASGVFELMAVDARGVLNLAGRDVVSKAEFVRKIAQSMSINPDWAEMGSVVDLGLPRANSLGLDVSRAEGILGYRLPSVDSTIAKLMAADVR